MERQPSADRIEEVALGFMTAKVLFTAIEFGLFTELAKGALDAEAIKQRLGLHPRSIRDFLDTLVALGLLERQGERYSNTIDIDFYLDRAKPTYSGALAEMNNARLYGYSGLLGEALKTGKPQNEIKSGEDVFTALYGNPDNLRAFLRAMSSHTLPSALVIAEKFPWQKYKTFADIGTAQGCLPVRVALAHPNLSGVGLDLPAVRPFFDEYVASFGLHDRVRFHASDFFKDPLPSADVLVMGMILHDWNLDEKQTLLRKAYDALPEGGALIVYERLIDGERKRNVAGLLESLCMLIETPGGFDYSGADCRGWMCGVGFRECYVEELTRIESMVVGIK